MRNARLQAITFLLSKGYKAIRMGKNETNTLDTNDMRFLTNQGFNNGNQFFNYLKDTFDCLYQERFAGPKMMSIGLHCRIIGKPGRFGSLKKFLDYTREFSDVWFASRISIANYWRKVLPYEE